MVTLFRVRCAPFLQVKLEPGLFLELPGGSSAGYVQMGINGGAVGYACDYAFLEEEADVMCKTLGHLGGKVLPREADGGRSGVLILYCSLLVK